VELLCYFTKNQKEIKKGKKKGRNTTKRLYTTAEKANARGNAQANIMIIPNCNANSKKSAGGFGF
jgi:hypothetical protein